MKSKPSGIRSDFLYAFYSSHISIESCKEDDNGAYSKPSTATKLFYVQFGDGNIKKITVCHSENDTLCINNRVGRKHVKKTVSPKNACELTRQYRYSKSNPGFVHIIATTKRCRLWKISAITFQSTRMNKSQRNLSWADTAMPKNQLLQYITEQMPQF